MLLLGLLLVFIPVLAMILLVIVEAIKYFRDNCIDILDVAIFCGFASIVIGLIIIAMYS